MPMGIYQNRRGLKKFGQRRCHLCKFIFPLNNDYFYRNYAGKGCSGFGWQCKPCKSENDKKYQKNHFLKDRFEFLKKFNFTCQYCGRKAPEVVFHIDHIIPKAKGGKDILENLTLACDECNIGKRDNLL
jgi:hypothetical protein